MVTNRNCYKKINSYNRKRFFNHTFLGVHQVEIVQQKISPSFVEIFLLSGTHLGDLDIFVLSRLLSGNNNSL